MTYFCSIGSQILYIFETHGIGQTPSSLERYLVIYIYDINFLCFVTFFVKLRFVNFYINKRIR